MFRGRILPAHMLLDLRIAVTVTRHCAKPYFRPDGLDFGRVRFALTGRHFEFLEGVVTSVPFESILPGSFYDNCKMGCG
jgi:hypothetical protein